ncbi:MAG: DUF1993 domain-containing protein [Candidatus Entotheonellia bacterium]
MSTALYTFTIPLLRRGLSILSSYMDKASAYAEARGIDPATLVGARLAQNMLPLSGQVQRASDKATNGVARLTGAIAPVFEDTESTLEELEAGIAKTLTFLDAVTPVQFEGTENRTIELRFRSVSGTMNGHTYLTKFLLPDVYFHIATAHGLLRHSGLQIGKADYVGTIDRTPPVA